MILNKEKINLIKAEKLKYFQKNKDYKRNTNSKYNDLNPQINNMNENKQNILSSDEKNQFIIQDKQDKNDNINKQLIFKKIDNNNNSNQIAYTEPENNIIDYDSNNSIKDKKYKKNISNVKKNEKVIISNHNTNNKKSKIEYKKIEYNNVKKNNNEYKSPIIKEKKFSDEEKDNLNNKNLNKKDIFIKNYSKNKNFYNSIDYQLLNTIETNSIDFSNLNTINNDNENVLDNNIYRIKRKIKVSKLTKTREKSVSLFDNRFKNKTANSFYIHKKPSIYKDNNNILNRDNQANIISDYNDAQIITYPDNIENLNDYNYRTIDNNFRINPLNQRKNKIRIIDNEKSIKEFNISFPDEENDYYYNKNANNYRTINNTVNKNNQHIEDYNNFNNMENCPPLKINYFNTITNNNNSKQKNNENILNKRNQKYFGSEYFTERNKKIYNNRNIISNELLDNNNINENNKAINNIGKTNTSKVLFKKRPVIYEMRNKNYSSKKYQDGKDIKDIENNSNKNNIYKEIKDKNILDKDNIQNEESLEISNKNENDNKNNKFEFYQAQRLSIINKPQLNDKIDKDIENINQNIFIIKKDNGKIIKINIDEDIEKINQQLLNEKFTVNKIPVKLIPLNNDNLENKYKIINEENEKLKNENESLINNDMMKEELIKNLIKEKQSLSEQINKLIQENNEQKNKIEKVFKENEKIKDENKKLNNTLNEIIKADKADEEIFQLGNLDDLNFNIDIESINDGQTEKMEEIKDLMNNKRK